MKARNFKQLQIDIVGREFDLAKQILSLTDGKDPDHRQSCPLCGVRDCFYFHDARFICERCNFSGELVQLVFKVRSVNHNEVYDIIVEANANYTAPTKEMENEPELNEAESPISNSTPILEFHEYANIFPMLDEAELAELCADLKKNGLTEPITMYAGKVLDGRNRAIACQKLGIKPDTIEFIGDDPLAFVLSKNLHRRHLNESQRAVVAAKLANMKQGERKNVKPANLPVSDIVGRHDMGVFATNAFR
jgi:ribosomal protein S27AE